MKPLPRLASVALAARCAELLAPLLDALWHDAPMEERNLVHTAIRDASRTAKTGRRTDTLQTTADEITSLVGRFELHLHGLPIEMTELPESAARLDEGQIRSVRDIIDVATRAARSANSTDGHNAFSECEDGVSWSFCITDDLGDTELADELNRTIESLYDCCGTKDITGDSKVWWTGSQWEIEN